MVSGLSAALLSLCFLVPAVSQEKVELTATTESGRETTIMSVSAETESLRIWLKDTDLSPADPVVEIRDLSALPLLRRVRFSIAPQIADYGFLGQAPGISELMITLSRVKNLLFLRDLPVLQVLHIETSRMWSHLGDGTAPPVPVDLGENGALEYLGMIYCDLTALPSFSRIPGTLRYINLTGNRIKITARDFPTLEVLKGVDFVFVRGNTVDPGILERYPNLSLAKWDSVVPDYWSSPGGSAADD